MNERYLSPEQVLIMFNLIKSDLVSIIEKKKINIYNKYHKKLNAIELKDEENKRKQYFENEQPIYDEYIYVKVGNIGSKIKWEEKKQNIDELLLEDEIKLKFQYMEENDYRFDVNELNSVFIKIPVDVPYEFIKKLPHNSDFDLNRHENKIVAIINSMIEAEIPVAVIAHVLVVVQGYGVEDVARLLYKATRTTDIFKDPKNVRNLTNAYLDECKKYLIKYV